MLVIHPRFIQDFHISGTATETAPTFFEHWSANRIDVAVAMLVDCALQTSAFAVDVTAAYILRPAP